MITRWQLLVGLLACLLAGGPSPALARSGAQRADPPCDVQPDLPGRFGLVFSTQDDAFALLGCPVAREIGVEVALQPFENGWMVWMAKRATIPATIYVFFADDQHYARFDDTYAPPGDPINGSLTPPPDLFEPNAGFGTVWRDALDGDVRTRLGWATSPEAGGAGTVQGFQRGAMIWTPHPREVFVLAASTADSVPQVAQVWRAYADTFSE